MEIIISLSAIAVFCLILLMVIWWTWALVNFLNTLHPSYYYTYIAPAAPCKYGFVKRVSPQQVPDIFTKLLAQQSGIKHKKLLSKYSIAIYDYGFVRAIMHKEYLRDIMDKKETDELYYVQDVTNHLFYVLEY
jgi:hypothetical protein